MYDDQKRIFFHLFLSIEERNLSSGTRGGEVHSRHFTYHRERERERERETRESIQHQNEFVSVLLYFFDDDDDEARRRRRQNSAREESFLSFRSQNQNAKFIRCRLRRHHHHARDEKTTKKTKWKATKMPSSRREFHRRVLLDAVTVHRFQISTRFDLLQIPTRQPFDFGGSRRVTNAQRIRRTDRRDFDKYRILCI